jgi:hypothetical protein
MDNDNYGHGLRDVLELQRKFNELELLMQRQIRLSASEDPVERLRQIAETMKQHTARAGDLLSVKSE